MSEKRAKDAQKIAGQAARVLTLGTGQRVRRFAKKGRRTL